ncbi:hypothetical protein Q765_11175 [Flavobacterium rivuli WB 3.3-2 = DSM 21788]|uniref:beta-lactamase n=1 Tax=Flavobacterium rivuli WB 3.3-2 = DSM 21788 TaxID=1121895 RepID=A0A0A2M2D4_9FLAO|nr:hypothetical protein Q765_11175 [Flavobacterium rivuli WB 3.3-2 = DSM 21788]
MAVTAKLYIFVLFCMLPANQLQAQTTTTELREQLEKIVADKKATVGISVLGLEDGDTLSMNGDRNFPMMSIFKFHIALTVLKKVDNGALSLKQKIFISSKELLDTWSPIKDKYPAGNITLTLDEILMYTVSHSDNNGCDVLLRLIGGTQVVQEYINTLNIGSFVIRYNEEQMASGELAKVNTTTPLATTKLLSLFYNYKLLEKKTTRYLNELMEQNSRGKALIKGKLPTGTKVAHRTGMSGTDDKGLQIALNDVGIITLPNGKHYAVAIYLNNITENKETAEGLIADVSKSVWDYFISKSN